MQRLKHENAAFRTVNLQQESQIEFLSKMMGSHEYIQKMMNDCYQDMGKTMETLAEQIHKFAKTTKAANARAHEVERLYIERFPSPAYQVARKNLGYPKKTKEQTEDKSFDPGKELKSLFEKPEKLKTQAKDAGNQR